MAVVGVALRLPGGLSSLDTLWSALLEGRDLVTRMPVERFDAREFTDADPRRPGRSYTAAAGVLEDIGGFDAEYFSLSPREADRMDPQQRILLELAAEGVDDAGIDPARLAGSATGVFVGVSNHAYGNLQLSRLETVDRHTMTGLASGNTAGRLSHAFDLRGPSLAVDTACSSSLVALHQACAFLGSGGELALAAGINVLIGPHEFVGFAKASMLSPTGRCRAFSAVADGFVRAEGGVLIVLKPLDRALADGDRVHAVIVATGTNSDGRTPGLAQPSAQAQAALLRQVYGPAGPDARELVYMEAHGTGTPVGDPLECEAIATALAGRCSAGPPLPIGSVKTNLGHLESASGLAGLLKALLVLRHRVIPPSLHGLPVNPAIDFPRLGLAPVSAATPLATSSGGLVGVNSFGFGGSNAHAVLAPAPVPALRQDPTEGPRPVLVSARTPGALASAVTGLADHLDSAGTDPGTFYDIAHTTFTRRGRHRYRSVVLAADSRTAAARLRAAAGAPPASVLGRGAVAFVYSGNGAQWTGMGRRLLTASEPGPAAERGSAFGGGPGASAFRGAVAEVDAVLSPLLGWSVREELTRGGDAARQARTEIAQPLLFTVQVALTAALEAYGVRSAGVAGHSVGEVAAAYACGALDLVSAAQVITHRSRAQARTAGSGRMAAVGLPAERALEELTPFKGLLELAAVNSPRDVTIAGDGSALDELARKLAGQGVFFRILDLDHAFHTAHMDPVEAELEAALATLRPQAGKLPFASAVTGALQQGESLTGPYWWHNVRRPVRLQDAVQALAGTGCDAFVEIGPHPVLSHYLRRILDVGDTGPTMVLPTLSRSHDGPEALERTVAALLAAGARTDVSGFFPVPGRVRDLPAYPWQREHHWHGSPHWFGSGCGDGRNHHPLLGERATHAEPLWQLRVDPTHHRWLADHVVTGSVVVPAAAFAEAALGAGRLHHQGPVQLQDLAVERALPLPFDDPAMDVRLQTSLDAADGTVRITSRDGTGPWRPHARAVVRRLLRDQPAPEDIQAVRARLPEAVPATDTYGRAAAAGIAYGPAFTVLTGLQAGDGEVLARYALPGSTEPDTPSPYVLHPALLDGALQAGAPLLAQAGTGKDHASGVPYLPSAITALRVWAEAPSEGWVHVRGREATPREVTWDIRLLDGQGRVIAEAEGCRLRRFETAAGAAPRRLATVLRAAPRDNGPAAPAPPLPAPDELARAAGRTGDGDWDAERYARGTALIDRLSAHFTLRALHTLDPGAAAHTPDSLIAAGALPVYRRMLHAALDQAERAGLLRRDGDGAWTPATRPDPRRVLDQLLRAVPGCATEAALHTYCGTLLPEVLLGRHDAVAMLLGESDRHWVENYYSTGIVPRHDKARMTALVRELVRHWPEDRPLRVLEAGAGTGALTTALLDVLPPGRAHYTFTDISETFFPRARARFAGHDHIDYRPLDLDRDPGPQGFAPGVYDLVVADNVLHATTRLRETVTRLAGLLGEGGHLLAAETHNLGRLLPCFGQLTNFWDTDDPDLRPRSPLLTAEQWHELLTAHGFDETARLNADGAEADHSVLIARRAPGRAGHGHAPVFADRATALGGTVSGGTVFEGTASEGVASEGVASEGVASEGVAIEGVVSEVAVPEVAVPEEAVATPATSWIVAAEQPDDPLAQALADTLAAALGPADEAPVAVVRATADPGRWAARLRLDESRPGLVLLLDDGGKDTDDDGPAGPDRERDVLERAVTRTAVLRAVAQACAQLPRAADPALWLITRPSGAVPGTGARPEPADCVPWAVARTLTNEQHRPTVRRLAFERGLSPEADAARLARELLEPTEEDEIVLTPAGRFVPRLRDLPAATAAADGRRHRLRLRRPGLGYGLDWVPAPAPPAPGPVEVTIEVRAAGLNYRDVLLATDSLPPGAEVPAPGEHGLGLECAGVVTAVGQDTALAVGDRVFACAPGALASHVVVPAASTGRIPDRMSFAEAATLPVAFFTVHHSLEHLARLGEGETLLVHGAAGGVGLAALQYARHVGARVIATAGSPAKRALLSLLGADHVLDSRTLGFADRVLELTGGEGVDVILNSLAGEAIARNLDILRPGGRCVELGKRDIHTGGRLALWAFRNNLSFHAVDALQMLSRQPALSARHFAELTHRVRQGIYRPLPHHLYPADDVMDAFALLRRSHHVGKVVIGLSSSPCLTEIPRRLVCDPDAAYLVIGGLTGLGAATAGFLADRGARHVTLVSRRGPATPGADDLVADLARRGAATTVHAADVADPVAMTAVLDGIAATGRPLRGIVHSAMVLRDALLAELSDEAVEAVLAPKLSGAMLLDRLTRDDPLDFFVVHSSASATVGLRAQAAYAAGNLAMEGIVRTRRAAGLPGLAVSWGLSGEVGTAAVDEVIEVLDRMGLAPMTTSQILAALEDLMTRPGGGPGIAQVAHIDFGRMATILPGLHTPRYSGLLPERAAGGQGAEARRLLADGGRDLTRDALADLLVTLVARVTQRAPERVDRTCGMDALGMDSLMATELVVGLQSELAHEIPTMEVVNADSIDDLASRILTLLGTTARP
ncbi:SDR family NAD(P)-dependent oxidoreductase [Streptomyces roseoverticillatus]|uniref:SDR family NAD(P)-dependent oxidoreductase n=1 Tax=Streptomyces roseoverticillatus TaxID=66429 RepID=A0ABV3IT04_9ACTN